MVSFSQAKKSSYASDTEGDDPLTEDSAIQRRPETDPGYGTDSSGSYSSRYDSDALAAKTLEMDDDVAQSRDSRHLSVLGSSLVFKGELVAEEDLLIQGRVEGSIKHNATNLTIGAKGRVKADIRARNIIVQGEVQGNLYATERVVIEASARVQGDIFAPRIGLKDGAKFKGSIDMDAPVEEPSKASSSAAKPAQNTQSTEKTQSTQNTERTQSTQKTQSQKRQSGSKKDLSDDQVETVLKSGG